MLEFSYIALSVIMIFLMSFLFFKYLKNRNTDPSIVRKWQFTLFGTLSIWLLYLMILSNQEVLRSTELPPKIPLLLFLPFFIFLIRFYIKHKNNELVRQIPLQYTAVLQSFRILVEVILLYSFKDNIVPKAATFEGINFDIFVGISAPLIAYFGYIKRSIPKSILVIWNVVGILMVLFVGVIVANAFYAPNELIEVQDNLSTDFVVLPYLLIPALLAPMAVFLHVVSLIQLRSFKQTT